MGVVHVELVMLAMPCESHFSNMPYCVIILSFNAVSNEVSTKISLGTLRCMLFFGLKMAFCILL